MTYMTLAGSMHTQDKFSPYFGKCTSYCGRNTYSTSTSDIYPSSSRASQTTGNSYMMNQMDSIVHADHGAYAQSSRIYVKEGF